MFNNDICGARDDDRKSQNKSNDFAFFVKCTPDSTSHISDRKITHQKVFLSNSPCPPKINNN